MSEHFNEVGNSRQTWGKRVLLATVPTNPAPYLRAFSPKNRDTLVDTGKFPQSLPVHVAIRFADPSLNNGAPILPFSDIAPATAGNNVVLRFTVRRGVDRLAPVTVDKYDMPVGFNNGVPDRVPFDIIMCHSLGVDVELLGNVDPASALWVEAIATVVDCPSKLELVGGYTDTVTAPSAVVASAASVLLAPRRSARRQLIVTNTSTNANLHLNFSSVAAVGTSTLVLPKNSFARYDGPVGGYCGPVAGIWDDPAPNGFAIVTEGINR